MQNIRIGVVGAPVRKKTGNLEFLLEINKIIKKEKLL